MKKVFTLIVLAVLLSSCEKEFVDAFSPTYGETGCVPASSLTIEELFSTETSALESSGICCESSGLLACCFGRKFICVDGSEGVGCGCPDR